MTGAEAQAVLSRLHIRGGLAMWRVKVHLTEDRCDWPAYISVRFQVPDRDAPVESDGVAPAFHGGYAVALPALDTLDERMFVERVQQAVLSVATHEVHESLCLDGERVKETHESGA